MDKTTIADWRALYPPHPCADVFPMMTDVELDALAKDIETNGLRQPIAIWQDDHRQTFVLDGRNRLDAYIRLGRPIADALRSFVAVQQLGDAESWTTYGPPEKHTFELIKTSDPAAHVISANIRRRHLTKEQQAELIVKTIEAAKAPTNDRATVARSFSPTNGKRGGSTKDLVLEQAVAQAAKHGISKRTVQNARAKLQGKTPAPRKKTPQAASTRVAFEWPADREQAKRIGVSPTPPVSEAIPLGTPTRAKKTDDLAPLLSSKSSEHYTPLNIIEAVRTCLKHIDLDPCSNEGVPHVPAKTHFTMREDGLSQAWTGRVYMNPPYGEEIDKWIQKLVKEFARKHVEAAIALLPARTDTEWFARLRDYPICFIRGRLTFVGNANTAPFPSMAVYLGRKGDAFKQAFGKLGDVWKRLP